MRQPAPHTTRQVSSSRSPPSDAPANVHQLPFFVVACDYTLIGEEYYAASAYLSKDARLLGSLKASDTVKIVLIATIVIGVALLTFGQPVLAEFFATQ